MSYGMDRSTGPNSKGNFTCPLKFETAWMPPKVRWEFMEACWHFRVHEPSCHFRLATELRSTARPQIYHDQFQTPQARATNYPSRLPTTLCSRRTRKMAWWWLKSLLERNRKQRANTWSKFSAATTSGESRKTTLNRLEYPRTCPLWSPSRSNNSTCDKVPIRFIASFQGWSQLSLTLRKLRTRNSTTLLDQSGEMFEAQTHSPLIWTFPPYRHTQFRECLWDNTVNRTIRHNPESPIPTAKLHQHSPCDTIPTILWHKLWLLPSSNCGAIIIAILILIYSI